MVAANVWGYFGVVDYPTFFVVGIAISVVYAVQFVSNGPVFIELFPPDKFGQFSSANAMMNSILLIFANYFGGVAIDRFGYRFIFIWDTIFTVAATLALLFVYVRWKRSAAPGITRRRPPTEPLRTFSAFPVRAARRFIVPPAVSAAGIGGKRPPEPKGEAARLPDSARACQARPQPDCNCDADLVHMD